MVNIYNFLSNVGQKVKQEIENNSFIVLVALVLITIPLHYRYSNSAIIGLSFYTLVTFKKENFSFNKNLFLPIVFYGLMCLSLLWSIDFKASLQALSKEIAFVLLPLCFLVNKPISNEDLTKALQYFAYSFLGYTVFYFLKALVRYFLSGDTNVFFYHELVTFDVNAIHVSVYISIAFFYFFLKKNKTVFVYFTVVLFLFFLILLSSKNVFIVFLGLLLCCTVWFLKTKWNLLKISFIAIAILVLGVVFFGNLKDRFLVEIQTNSAPEIANNKPIASDQLINNISIREAWTTDQFQYNDFFPGAALRVYQFRIFIEMLQENPIFFKGFGLNAAQSKIIEKTKQHNLYVGYANFNFHNQYIQIFAELGAFGFLILLLILGISFKNAIINKDFMHFSFAVLMISLFLTESFLSRQRGIVFFVMMYCLFNSTIEKKIRKN